MLNTNLKTTLTILAIGHSIFATILFFIKLKPKFNFVKICYVNCILCALADYFNYSNFSFKLEMYLFFFTQSETKFYVFTFSICGYSTTKELLLKIQATLLLA